VPRLTLAEAKLALAARTGKGQDRLFRHGTRAEKNKNAAGDESRQGDDNYDDGRSHE
jgi:hypothetical protein